MSIQKKFDLMPEDAWLIEREWFKLNLHVDGPYCGTFSPPDQDRSLTSYFNSDEMDIGLLTHCFFRLRGYVKTDKKPILNALRTANEMMLAGIELLGAEYGDELVEKTGKLLRRQYASNGASNTSSQWMSVSYPVLIKSKNGEVLWKIGISICEIQNHTQWTAQRVINEAFTRGLKELIRKKCKIKPSNLYGPDDIAGETPVWVYGLVDPRDGEVHYIGRSKQPFIRLEQHLGDKELDNEKGEWLTSLAGDNLQPDIRILDCVAESEADTIETEYINMGLSKRWPLTNIRGAK